MSQNFRILSRAKPIDYMSIFFSMKPVGIKVVTLMFFQYKLNPVKYICNSIGGWLHSVRMKHVVNCKPHKFIIKPLK